MVGMNNYFYSFKNGNLWRHNSNSVNRNNFYDAGVAQSTITTVFNKAPLESKLFKTIELEASPVAWTVYVIGESPIANFPDPDEQDQNPGNTLSANQSTGFIDNSDFELKEGSWFAYLRNQSTSDNNDIPTAQYGLRSIKGIGIPVNPSAPGPPPVGVNGAGTATCTIQFPSTTPISTTLSVGDFLYQGAGSGSIIGQVTAIDLIGNVVTINNDTAVITSLTPATDTDFTYYVQNATAESHGLVGHYLEITLSLLSGAPAELFAIKSDIMKSYP
jgi:hypothetical protein